VAFNGLAAEIDAPRIKRGVEFLPSRSFWRAPYMCSFRSGNFDFIAIATHARWGDQFDARVAELQMLADWIDTRFASQYVEDHDLLVLGDFNVPSIGVADKAFKALTSRGLMMPDALKDLKAGDMAIGGSNLGKDARYDQILHLPTLKKRFANLGGAVDFFVSDSKIKELFPDKRYTRQQFTFQLSDHFPVWVQVNTDIDGERLTQIVQEHRDE